MTQLIVGVNDKELDPPKEGYTRIYQMFHEYQDYSPAEMEEMANDPLMKLLKEEITKQINLEIIEMINNGAKI